MPETAQRELINDRDWPCPSCGYDLRASFTTARWKVRCPECGQHSSRDDVIRHLYSRGRIRRILWMIQRYGLGIALVPAFFLLLLLTNSESVALQVTGAGFVVYGLTYSTTVVGSCSNRVFHIVIHSLHFGLTSLILAYMSLVVYIPLLFLFSMFG